MKEVSEDLKNEIKRRLPEIPEGVYEQWDHEEKFIDIAVRQLDGLNGESNGQSFRIQVREMHQSPYMDYNRPSYVSDKNPELADILYIINFFQSGQVVERRCSLAQAKFTQEGDDDDKWASRRWDVETHQYELLARLKEMEFTWKGADREFTLEGQNRSFTTYIFASDFLPPFFQNVKRVNRYLYDRSKEKPKYSLPRKEPWKIDVYHNRLLSMISGQYGQPFSQGDDVYDLLKYMFDEQRKKTFTMGNSEADIVDDSGDPVPDGGSEASSGLMVVIVDIGLDSNIFYSNSDMRPPDQVFEDVDALGRNHLKKI